MNQRKDVYEHLVQTYLDSTKGKRFASKAKPKLNIRILFFLNIIFLVVILASIFYFKKGTIEPDAEKLFLQPEIIKLGYNFLSPAAKKQMYNLEFGSLDLRRFRYLSFRVREIKAKTANLNLRVEIENTLNENSEIYLAAPIKKYWQRYKFDLKDFKKINDWSKINKIFFIAEEWNTQEKEGLIYIEGICFIKQRRSNKDITYGATHSTSLRVRPER